MKKIKFFIIIIAFISIFLNNGFSQIRKGTFVGSLEYSVAINMGRASDFISDPGWAGVSLSIRQFIKNNISAGLTTGWNIFGKEEQNGLTEFTNGAVSGPQARYFNYLPIMANVSYYISNNRANKFVPYIQANVGAVYIKQRAQLGVFVVDNDNWHFGVGPEIGFMIKLGKVTSLVVNGKYNYALSSGTNLAGEDNNSYSFINANIGLTYMR